MQVSKCVLVCDKTEESSFYRFLLSNLLFPVSAFLDLGFSPNLSGTGSRIFLRLSHTLKFSQDDLVPGATGYLCPWDESSFRAIISASILGLWLGFFSCPLQLHGSDHCFASDACHFQQELSVPDSSVSLSQGDYDSSHFPYFLYQGWGRP